MGFMLVRLGTAQLKEEIFEASASSAQGPFYIWTASQSDYSSCFSSDIIMSYITQQELNSRGGTEKQKQVFLNMDLNTFRSITTARTFVARNSKAALQSGDAWLESRDSLDSSSSSTMDAGNDSDSTYAEKYLRKDGDGDEDGDGDDKDAEAVSGSDSDDKANKDPACCETAELAELEKTILEEFIDIASMISSLFKKDPASGSAPPGNLPSSSSTSLYPPPKFESDSIHSLLSRLTAAIEKELERREHLTKINNCE